MQVKDEEYRSIVDAVDDLGKSVEVLQSDVIGEQKQLRERIEQLEAEKSGGGSIHGHGNERDLKALGHFMKTGERGRLPEGESKTISTATPSSNAMVPERIASDILSFAKDSSALMSIVRTTQTRSANYSRILRVAPPGTGWIGETGSRTGTTDPSFRRRAPTAGEVYAVVQVTNHMLDDNELNLANFLINDVGGQFGRDLDVAILTGNGSSRPTGILNTAPVATDDFASPLRNVAAIESVAAPSPNHLGDHLMNAYFTLQPAYRLNARWIMNSQTLNAVRQLKASTGGDYLWQPNLSAHVDAPGGLLLGKPITIVETMDAIGESPLGYPVIVGDFDMAYELIQIGTQTLVRDPYTTPGFTNFYVAQRWGGCVMVNDALKAVTR